MREIRPATLLRTVRHLRRQQVAGQLRRALGARVRPRSARGEPPRLALSQPLVPFLPPPEHVRACDASRLRLIEREVPLATPIDWSFRGEGPLWAYHLHQMEWLRSERLDPDQRLAILLDWVDRHPQGVGWDAGPISIRAFQWLKLLTGSGMLPNAQSARVRLCESLADQLATLSDHRELHLLGNHYLWNLLALVLGGLSFEGSESDVWLGFEAPLRRELELQVLPDGGHEERSPMYHALLLENVLDLLNVLGASTRSAPLFLEPALRDVAGRMLGALEVFTHPDGRIALFQDSAFGIAAEPEALLAYASGLGVEPQPPRRTGFLDLTGYVRLEAGPFSLLASVAGPSPPHQPGHAHCDALAFELTFGTERVVTDTGVYEYAPGARRDTSRATRSHATVVVGGRDQAELWAAHRVGGRPRVSLLDVRPGESAEADCRGWATPRVRHWRRFEVGVQGVELRDRLEGGSTEIQLVLPLAHGIACDLEGHHAMLQLPGGSRLRVDLPRSATWRIDSTPCYPTFGVEQRRASLLGRGRSPGEFLWQIRPLENAR